MAEGFSVKSLIDQMETRYKELSEKMEGFVVIQEEMATLSKAMKVMRGEKLTPGGPTGPRQSKKEWAKKIIASEDVDGAPAGPNISHRASGAKDALYAFLKANPKGVTSKQIGAALSRGGIPVTNHTVHNALRKFKDQLVVLGESEGHRGHNNLIYALKKEARK